MSLKTKGKRVALPVLSRRDLWPLLLLLVAALLRFHHLAAIEHNVDQAYPIWQALNTLEHGVWPLVGQGTSVLFANPALTGYLYLPFVALTRSPLGAYLLVISLNTLAVLLAFRAVRGLLGYFPALVAAALMAVNPWVIEYSRATWVQSLLPFFTCAIAWLLWPVLLGRSRNPQRRTLLALILLALFTQTYLLAYLMLAPVGVLTLIFRRRVPRRALWTGAAVILAASALYAGGLLAQSDQVEAATANFASAAPHLSSEALSHAVRLVTGSDYAQARGTSAPANDWLQRQFLSQMAHYVILALLLLGIARALIARRAESWILLIWFGLPVLLMSYVGQPVHPFYQMLGLPAGYALVGWGVKGVESRPLARYGLAVLLAAFGALMAVNSSRFAEETLAAPAVDAWGRCRWRSGFPWARRSSPICRAWSTPMWISGRSTAWPGRLSRYCAIPARLNSASCRAMAGSI